jgi:nitroreductase
MSSNEQMREALEEIALAGMSGSGQESEEALQAWHARQAWKFIAIAARALEAHKAALTAPAAKCATCNGHGLVGGFMQDGSGHGEGCPDCNPEPAPAAEVPVLREILRGIDKDEGDSAWWETSTGAEFGAKKLAELEAIWPAAAEVPEAMAWDQAVEVANVPAVHEIIAALCEDPTEDNAVCAIQAIIAARDAQWQSTRLRGGVPEGWKPVPVEPTISMLLAGDASRLSMEHPTRASAAYHAMLTAAPQATAAALDAGVVRDAERWQKHADVMKAATLPDSLHIALRMNINGQTWGNEASVSVHELGASKLGIKFVGLKAEDLFQKLDAAMSAQAGKGGA